MIPLLKPKPPSIEAWSKYLKQSYAQSSFSNGGPCVKQLEGKLQSYIQLEHTPVLMCNATIALTVALQAFDLQSSDVLIPTFTFAATAHSVIAAGCNPVFVDLNPYDCHMSLEDAELRITSNTRAMVVVQSLGYIVDYAKYEQFASRHGLTLIFDSAAALGANYDESRKVGTAGDCEVFSLHVTKTFGIGEGALVTSPNASMLQRCRQIINFGFNVRGESETVGTNAKMSEFHAAVGLSVLDTLELTLFKKKRLYREYKKSLIEKKIPVRTLGENHFYHDQAYQVMPIIFQTEEERQKVIEVFQQNQIGWRIYYSPLHTHPYFKDLSLGSYHEAESISSRILCIPFFEEMENDQLLKVTELIWKNTLTV